MYVFLNDMLVPEPEARVSVYDHGFLYGDGVYETMRAYGGIVFMLDEHIGRLGRSAGFIKLNIPERDFIRATVYKTIAANKLSDAYIRITVSRGKGPVGLDPELCGETTYVVIAREFSPYPKSYYRDGTKLILAKTRRNLIGAINPKIKSLNFLNNILARIEAKERGAHEAIMLNAEGLIAEGTVSNLFFVREGVLCTPSEETGILDGITRGIIISLAKRNGIDLEEGMFRPADLLSATEVFFTNTTSEVMPVSRVDDVKYGIGEVTRTLRKLYRKEVTRYLKNP